MESFNFKNTLRWNWPADLGGDVIYIVQYKIASELRIDFKTICVTQEQQCESSVITYESNVRVRAQLNLSTSDWATIYFDPYSETVIGAPNVKVSSRSGFLDVSFDGPFVGTDEGSLKEKYGELLYRVVYWKESDPAHVLVVNTSQNTDILQDLEPWTMYCVKVQAYVSQYKKAGDFSPVICKETTDRKRSSWKIVVVFLGSMALITVVTLLLTFISFKVYKMTQYLFYPSYTFPQHLKEYLSKPFYNAPYLPPQPTEECGESCEQLTFISEEAEEKDAA
ncbi:interleukin-10 receptor subunit beta-like [Bufo bufo]|uniref:interleukin-10 receptor subunit beta-like n=1 Tax=Bufo bufo TaxID=8384 RepID=UPI001ABDC94F|nr:interleukin-10 receptor subunit beta-like [Bufo bufo]